MKKTITILFLLLIDIVFAQNINFDNIDSSKILYLANTTLEANFLNNLSTENNSSTKIIQIGNDNTANINILFDTKINSLQNGDLNTVTYQDLHNPKTNTELNIITEGTGNYIEVLGSNSISDGMKITTTGNDKIIFVRNY